MVLLGMDVQGKDGLTNVVDSDSAMDDQEIGSVVWEPEIDSGDSALSVLNAVAATASMTLDVDEMLQRTLELALEFVGVEAGAISVLDEESNELVFRVQRGWQVNDFVQQGVRVPADEGLSGVAVKTGKPIVTGDVSDDGRVVVSDFKREGVKAMALAPMRARGGVLGVLSAMSYEPYDFSADEIAVICGIADQIGVALDNARLFKESQRRVEELSELQALSTSVASSLDLWDVLEAVASSTLTLSQAAAAEIYLYESDDDRLAFATALSQTGERNPIDGRPCGEGPVACAVRERQVIAIEDLATAEERVAAWRTQGVQALVAVPFQQGTRVLGALVAAFESPRAFSDHDLRILQLLAEQAAIAVERTRFFASETRRSTQLALINQVARQATATLNLNEILDMAAVTIRRSFSYFNVALFLLDSSTGELVLRAIAGGHSIAMREGYRQPVGEGVIGRVAEEGDSFLVNDIANEPRYQPIVPTTKPIGSELAVPILRGDDVIGVLDIRNLDRGSFDQQDIRAMETLADQLVVAIENARLYGETQRRVAELAAVQQTNLQVVSSLDTRAVLESVAHNVLDLVEADDVQIFLRDLNDGSLTFGASLTRTGSALEKEKAPGEFVRIVLDASRSIVINHAREHPYFASNGDGVRPKVEAVAGFPLMGNAGVVGVMVVSYWQPHVFSPDELRVLGLLASQAAVAITNASLYEETRCRLDELTMLYEVSLAATSTLSPEKGARRVIDVVQESLGFEHISLWLADRENGVLEPLAVSSGLAECPTLALGEGLVGGVIERGEPQRIGDISDDSRYVELVPDVSSLLIIPMVVGEKVIGAIRASDHRRHGFTSDDQRLMTTVGRQLAVVIENARLYQETERRLSEVSLLYRLARQMNTSLDVQERLDSIVQSLRDAMGCRSCSIALLEPVNRVLEIRAAAGIEGKWRNDFNLRLGEGVAGKVALEGEPRYVPDTEGLDDFIFFDPAVRSLLTVPMSVQQRVIGTLTVDSSEPHAFSDEDERLLIIGAAQAAVAIENARLYSRLENRAKNLTEVCAELQEADRLKEEMVQNVSHELRTPLTFIKGYVEMLLAGDAGSLTDEQREYLGIVVDKTDAVTRLVNDIMFLQHAGQLPDELELVSMTELARQAVRGCAATAEREGMDLVADLPDKPLSVRGEPRRLLQVFDNLLGNAIKFTPDGGEISVAVREAGSMIEVCVSDEGIGIPEELQKRIFERFYQVDGSARRRFAGVGLGLTIAQRIVEAHGGKIWVESKMNEGSAFYFTLPKCQTEV